MPALHKQSLNWQDRFSGHVTDVELCRQIDLCTVGQSSIVERGRHLGYREHLLGRYVCYIFPIFFSHFCFDCRRPTDTFSAVLPI